MTDTISERLKRLIEEESGRGRPAARPPKAGPSDAAERFAPVRKAAEEIAAELKEFPELHVTVEPESVWIELYDKHFLFTIDSETGRFIADEIDYSWLEPELREERSSWEDAESCIQALLRACARYVVLARAIRTLQPKRQTGGH